jgi:hypothetical protein
VLSVLELMNQFPLFMIGVGHPFVLAEMFNP